MTPITAAVQADPAIVAMLEPYRRQFAAVFDTPIGSATGVFPRTGTLERTQEAAIGNIVADSMRTRYGTQLALTNGGGLRAALPSSYAPADSTLNRPPAPAPWDLVTGDVFTVLPFGNIVVTRTVTGSQLYAVLEHGIGVAPASNGRFRRSRASASRTTRACRPGRACSRSPSTTGADVELHDAGSRRPHGGMRR